MKLKHRIGWQIEILHLIFLCLVYFSIDQTVVYSYCCGITSTSTDKDAKLACLSLSNRDNADLLVAKLHLSPDQNELIFLPMESV